MPYRIMLALDGSSRAERAIPTTDAFARALHAEVELTQVIDSREDLDSTGSVATEAMVAAKTQLAQDYLLRVRQRFRGVVPNVDVHQGRVAETIIEQARSREIDLIVMSTHGHTGLVGTLLGSVARDVVRASTVPVLVLRARAVLRTNVHGLRVLAPLDATELGITALGPLLRLAKPLGWRLHLCWIADLAEGVLSGPAGGTPDDRVRGVYPERVAELDRAAERIKAAGMSATVHLQCGDIGPRIVRLARELDAGVIAMSTHGRKGLGRLVLGSVTDYVIEHAGVPVLTLRSSDTERRADASERERWESHGHGG